MSERHPSESGSPEPLGPQHFPSPFTKRRDHPSTTRTTTTTTTDELLDDDPAPFCSTSLAPTLPALFLSLSLSPFPLPTYPPTIPHPTVALPRTYNLHHHAQPIQRLTFSLHSLGPLTLSISLFSSLTLRLDSLFLARPLLRHHLQPYISLSFSLPPFTLSLSLLVSRFIARSLASRPSSRPRAHRYCLPLSHPYTIVLFWLVVV